MNPESQSNAAPLSQHDKWVGHVAGAICNTLLARPELKGSCLILTPAITFKVKKALLDFPQDKVEDKSDVSNLAKKIQESITPILQSYEIPASVVSGVSSTIETAVSRALKDIVE